MEAAASRRRRGAAAGNAVGVHAGFVDAAFLRRLARSRAHGAAAAIRPDPVACVGWLDRFGIGAGAPSRLARVYWYAPIVRPREAGRVAELTYYRTIGKIPKVTVRARAVADEHSLTECAVSLTVDLVLLAARSAIDTAIVISADAGLAPALERTRAEGTRVVLALPNGARAATPAELIATADEFVELDPRATREILRVAG